MVEAKVVIFENNFFKKFHSLKKIVSNPLIHLPNSLKFNIIKQNTRSYLLF